uniref:Uncharacterized protein n=1 Tax=Setaria italica TaxID=4555 RepID=K3XMW6_SETIT
MDREQAATADPRPGRRRQLRKLDPAPWSPNPMTAGPCGAETAAVGRAGEKGARTEKWCGAPTKVTAVAREAGSGPDLAMAAPRGAGTTVPGKQTRRDAEWRRAAAGQRLGCSAGGSGEVVRGAGADGGTPRSGGRRGAAAGWRTARVTS